MRALILTKTHACCLVRPGPGAPWGAPAFPGLDPAHPLPGLKAAARAALGLDLPGPAGLALPGGLAFLLPGDPPALAPAEPASEAAFFPLPAALRLLPPADADALWRLYTGAMLGGYHPPSRDLDVFCFGSGPEMAARLAHLVVKGRKRATTGWTAAMRQVGATIPEPGLVSVVTDGFGIPLCVIETLEVRHVRFRDVGEDIARGEGEGDLSLADWREGHREYFQREAAELGRTFDEDELVFAEIFRVLRVLGAADG